MRLNLKQPIPYRTRERELIFDQVLSLGGHFTPEELQLALLRHGHRVSRATIYRSVELLVGQGVLQRVQLDRGGARYEVIAGRTPHAHLFCLGCGQLLDYSVPRLSRLSAEVWRNRSFQAEHVLLRICGYCKRCAPPRRKAFISTKEVRHGKGRKRGGREGRHQRR